MNWNKLSWDLNQIKYEKDEEGEERPQIENVTGTSEHSLGWMASVDIDVKLHSTLTESPSGHYTSTVRISPFVASAKYSDLNPSVKGVCFGATITYAGLLRLMK